MADVIDFTAFRTHRAVLDVLSLVHAETIGKQIVEAALTGAERVFAVSGPIAATDPVMSRGINAWGWRQVRRAVGRTTGRVPWQRQATELAHGAYRGRLLALVDEQAASQRGLIHG